MSRKYKRELTSEEMKALSDEDIDFSDIPELDADWFRRAKVVFPESKERLTVRFDRDIVAYFRRAGPGYQTRMNAVLRAYVDAHKRGEPREKTRRRKA